MKGIFVVLSGIGDLPCDMLGGKTPLEAAETPNLDFFTTRGKTGYLYPVKPGIVPESYQAMMSIFGNDQFSGTRGQLEAKGSGLKITRGDLALRANFATIDDLKDGNIIDRRVGRTLTTKEAELLTKSLNKIKFPCEFTIKSTIQHRAALVFRGGFSDNISENDHYYSGKIKISDKIVNIKPLDDDENSQYSANIVNEFLEKAYNVLNKHPVNEERRKRGLFPANYILVRGPGIEIPKLKRYNKWLSVAYMPLEKGFSELSRMKIFSFNYPKFRSLDAYENLKQGLEKACKFSIKTLRKHKKDFDYAYIHIKEIDLPGQDNKPFEKKDMIEYVDKTLFKFLRRFAPPNKINLLVGSDHSTPSRLKRHSADPVPILLYDPMKSIPRPAQRIPVSNVLKKSKNNPKLTRKKFSEKEARKGDLGMMMGGEMLKKVGFVR